MKVRLQIAERRAEVLACQYLVAEVYNHEYDIVFSDDSYDLDAKIEPWPHRYLMAFVEGDLVGCVGLYLRDTYVQRFGRVSDDEIRDIVIAAGADPARWSPARKREPTKLSVRRSRRGMGLGRALIGAAHATAFRDVDGDPNAPHLFVACAKRSIWKSQWGAIGIGSRPIKPFPIYKVHERYSSPEDPMDSRVLIPDLDVPPSWLDLSIPGEHDLEALRSIR